MAKSSSQPDKRSARIIGRRYRYTSDYQIVPALGPNDRGKRVIYTADWVLPVNEEGEYRSIVLRLRLLTLAVWVCVLGAMAVVPLPMTHKWYVPVLVTALFPLCYQVMSLTAIPGQREKLERQRWEKGFVRMGTCAAVVLVILGLSALGDLAYWLVAAFGTVEDAAPFSLLDGGFVLLLVLAGGSELLIRKQNKRVRTETVANHTAED